MKVRGFIALLICAAALTFMLLLNDCGTQRRQAVADQRIAQAKQEENNRVARERKQEAQRAVSSGSDMFKRGLYPQGVNEYEKAVELGDVGALNSLAWHFATCKDPSQHNGKRAVELALQATKSLSEKPSLGMTGRFAGPVAPEKGESDVYLPEAYLLDTLAAAYARNEQFEQAITTQMRVQSLGSIRGGGEERLKLYRQQKAYQEE